MVFSKAHTPIQVAQRLEESDKQKNSAQETVEHRLLIKSINGNKRIEKKNGQHYQCTPNYPAWAHRSDFFKVM